MTPEVEAGPPSSGHPIGSQVLPVVLTGVLLVGLLPLAMASTVGAALALGAALFILVLFTFGLERTAAGVNIAAMFAAPLTGVTMPGASFVTLSDLLIVVAFGLLAPILMGRSLVVPWQFVVGSVGFFLVGALASLRSDVPIGSLSLLVRVMLATVALPLLFAWWAPRGRTLVALAIGYVGGVVFNTFYAVLTGADPITGRYRGLTEQPTAFGYAGLLATCLLPFIIVSLPQSYRWMAAIAGFICAYSIWISGSRASLVVLMFIALIYPVVERSLKFTAVLVLGGIFLVANIDRILNTGDGSNALNRLLGNAGAAGSNQERERGLANAWAIIKEHPILGHGFDFDVFLAHNIYAQVAAAMGAIGILVFLVMLWGFVKPLWGGPSPYRLLAYPALAYIVAGPITPNLGSRYVGILLALALVAASMVSDDDESDDDDDEEPASAQRPQYGVA